MLLGLAISGVAQKTGLFMTGHTKVLSDDLIRWYRSSALCHVRLPPSEPIE